MTGGMGLEGVIELQKFVEAGGVLITLAAAVMPPSSGSRARSRARPAAVLRAGPIVQAEILRPEASDLLRVHEKTIPVRYGNGPLLTCPRTNATSRC